MRVQWPGTWDKFGDWAFKSLFWLAAFLMSIKAQMDNKHVDRSLFITWGRGCGGFWLCHEKKSPDNPIMLFNILMIPPLSGSNWQSIFCSPFILCWRRLISPLVSPENLTCPKFSVNRTKRDSKLRYCSRGVKNEGDRVGSSRTRYLLEIRRSSQLRTLLKLVVVSRTWKKFQARTGFEPMTSAIPVQH